MFLSHERDESIGNLYPELLQEWDYIKNGDLKPELLTYKSHKKVWWKCPKGHSYQNTPHKRTERKQGCPFCSGRYATEENNLLILNPDICVEWDYEKNEGKRPEDFTSSSSKKVWWLCKKCANSWQATIANRGRGNSCPKCAEALRRESFNQSIILKNGSLANNKPEILEEWDYTKNNISPEEVTSHSARKVWWKCNKCGNEWESSISNRTRGNGCPVCSRKNRAQKRERPVRQYSLDGQFIKEFASATEAAKETGVGSITVCCQRRCKISGGYIWRYADEEEE